MIIGLTWPEPLTTGAGVRMMQLIAAFRARSFQIIFASAAAKTQYSADLSQIGVEEASIVLNDSRFDNWVLDLRPDIVIFDRFVTEEQFGWRVAESVPDALRILDTEDLHSLRRAREIALKAERPFSISDWKNSALAKREIASIYRSDLSLIISEFEYEKLQEVFKIDPYLLSYLPFIPDAGTDRSSAAPLSFEDREGFVWIGNGKHAPNVDALIWLKLEIWPLIRKELPTANLRVYGAYFPENLKDFHDPSTGFLVEGWISDSMQAIGKGRVSLVPLRFGAGLKGKLMESMNYGTPFVTTAVGIEGYPDSQLPDWLITEDAVSFARAAVRLSSEKNSWYDAQRAGWETLNLTGKMDHIKLLLNALQKIRSDLKEHRVKNFIGAMLRQHTANSAKYLSKWIEAKNKLGK